MKTLASISLAAALAIGSVAASYVPASAHGGWGGWHGGWHGGGCWGCGWGWGLGAGLALGAILSYPYYAYSPYPYYGYYDYPYHYHHCWWRYGYRYCHY
jgi:hypothetical protein